MDPSLFVEDGVLIRIVRSARPNEGGDQRALAGESPAWKHQRAIVPPHHAGVHEHELRGIFCDVLFYARREEAEGGLSVLGSDDLFTARVERVGFGRVIGSS